jgi:hypothetical protein
MILNLSRLGLGAWPAEAGKKNDVGLLEKLSW